MRIAALRQSFLAIRHDEVDILTYSPASVCECERILATTHHDARQVNSQSAVPDIHC